MNKQCLTSRGDYYRIAVNGRWRRAHRYVMELHLLKTNPMSPFLKEGKLRKEILVHHKDGNKFNNKISNLECMTCKQHSAIHLDKYPGMPYNEKMKIWHTGICACGSRKDKYRKQCITCYRNRYKTK